MQVRLKKLTNAGLSRDNAGAQAIGPLWQRYLEARDDPKRAADPELVRYRWMLEELRVSLFAQELKTSIPVSIQRLEKQWESLSK
jgi:ATP-dependent helicase HrpA